MSKICRDIRVKRLLCLPAMKNFIINRGITILNVSMSRYLFCPLSSTSLSQNTVKVNFRSFSCTPYLKQQSSPNVKDAEVNRLPEENADKSEDMDTKILDYIELATDTEKKKKILMILMEHGIAKLEGKNVPAKLNTDDMRELLNLYSFSSRFKYMSFLHKKECAKESQRKRRERQKIEYQQYQKDKVNIKPSEHITYGIANNTLLLRMRRRSLMRFYNQRLANSALYGQKFIIDLDYDGYMRKQDSNDCSEQLIELYCINRRSTNPFDLFFCNACHDHPTMHSFRKYMLNLYAPDNFVTTTDLSYLDIFPKEKLVYITPYAKEPMTNFDHNSIYILGGLVDKAIKENVVMAKVKREGLKAVHLPFEDYVMWGRGSKSLPLNHLMQIITEARSSGDWNKAFSFVPQRKLVRSLDLFSEF